MLGRNHPDVVADVAALAAILDGRKKYVEAERLYRHLNSSLSLAVVALHQGAWERAAGKALRWFDFWDTVSAEVPVRELVETLKTKKETRAVVFDGIITQRILDIAAEMNMHSVVGTKMGTITKQPAGIEVWTRSDFGP